MLRLNKRGFTLIEVLIAIVILAISLTALLRSLQSNSHHSLDLRNKTCAEWIAHNTLNGLQLGTISSHPSHEPSQKKQDHALQQNWQTLIQFSPTTVAHVYQVHIAVESGARTWSQLEGYVYATED